MLQQEQDEISSQISAQIFEFCDPELFQETLQNSEATSSPNCCYGDNSSYATHLTLSQELEAKFISTYQDSNNGNNTDSTLAPTATTNTTNTTTSSTSTANINGGTTTNNNNGGISIIFDSQEEIDNDISASIDFSTSPSFSVPPYLMGQQDQFDFSSVQTQMPLADSIVEGFSNYPSDHVPPLMSAPPYSSVFEEDCLSSVPSYVPLNPSSPSCSFLGPNIGAYMPTATMNAADSTGIFATSILMASELQAQDVDYQGDNGGIFCQDSLSRDFNPNDLQVLFAHEGQQLLSGTGNSTSLATENPMAEDPNFKVGKLSPEEKKEKIHRYMKKRNERNFTKKIKDLKITYDASNVLLQYACRKTLADKRPRNRGRFAKNNECGKYDRPPPGCDDEDDRDDEEVVVKQEEDMVDSSDIFSHISGVNSLKCSFPIQSWMS